MRWSSELIAQRFHVHRLVLPHLYAGSFSFPFAMHLYMLYDFCKRYEANPYNTGGRGTSADFLWMIILGMLILNAINYFMDFPMLSEQMLFLVLYVWSRREADSPVKMFGFGPFKAVYLPLVYMIIRLIMGGSIVGMVMGAVAGHVYFFVFEVLPREYPNVNVSFLATPSFCIRFTEYFTGMSVPRNAPPPGTAAAAGQRNEARAAAAAAAGGRAAGLGGNMGGGQGTGYQWGRGRVLGAS
jgi:Derlin-2/3